jgi:hypothetical protein
MTACIAFVGEDQKELVRREYKFTTECLVLRKFMAARMEVAKERIQLTLLEKGRVLHDTDNMKDLQLHCAAWFSVEVKVLPPILSTNPPRNAATWRAAAESLYAGIIVERERVDKLEQLVSDLNAELAVTRRRVNRLARRQREEDQEMRKMRCAPSESRREETE